MNKVQASRFTWLLLAAPLAAGAASLAGPHLGLMFDPGAKEIRPLLGIPGAATIGAPFPLTVKIERAWVAPGQDYALAVEKGDGKVLLISLGNAGVSATPVTAAPPAPARVVWSASGSVAAFYYARTKSIEVLRNLPAGSRIATSLYLSGIPTVLAAEDDGRTVLAGVGDTVFLVTESGEVPVLTGVGKIGAIAFGARNTALVADTAGNRIYRIRDVTGNPDAEIVAEHQAGIDQPVAIAASRDKRFAFVANSKSKSISIIDLMTRTHSVVSCACEPATLERIGGGELFRLTQTSDRPLWVLDAGVHVPRTLFIPANTASERSSAH